MRRSFFLISILALVFSSCNKKKDDTPKNMYNPCSDFESPYASNDGPVIIGGALRLSATSNETDVMYEWTGPNNFFSTMRNPEIGNIAFGAAGLYYARITNDVCISNTQFTKVVVLPPCSIAENTGVFGTASWNFYSSVNCGFGSSGMYGIYGWATSGELHIEFSNSVPPQINTVYGVEPGSNPNFDSTNVQLVLYSGTDILRGQQGNVYVTADNGKISASFCNVQFHSSTTSTTYIGEAEMSCQ